MKIKALGKSSAVIVVALIAVTSFASLLSTPTVLSSNTTVIARGTGDPDNEVGTRLRNLLTDFDLYPEDAAYMSKISAGLKNVMQATPTKETRVVVYTTDPIALGRFLRENGVSTPIGAVLTNWHGVRPIAVSMPAFFAVKIAAFDSVQGVSLFSAPAPPRAIDSDIPNGQDHGPNGVTGPSPNSIVATRGHHVDDAWAAGYNGTGVRVAIMDSGVDFANPDLLGTWVIEENTSSPYLGWPIAFDPHSMEAYMTTGYAYPTEESWYVDTSFNSTSDVDGLLRTFSGRQYNVSGVSSASGYYHVGLQPAPTLETRFGRSPGLLVTDSASPYVYDTVYVDLNDNGRFSDDKPANISSPMSFADYRNASDGAYNETMWNWGDGMPDLSGGLVYFIADGVEAIPYSDVIAMRYSMTNRIPGNGDLVALMIGDTNVTAGDHGTLCASAVVAQNRTGSVQGFAPGAKIIPIGNIYDGGFSLDVYAFATEGYDGVADSGDEAMVASASYGSSNVDNDGWDYESRLIDLVSTFNKGTVFVVATGNGGPGFGTATSPAGGSRVISVGASTNYYTGLKTPWETGNTWNFGDVQPWSNRGPSALGRTVPDVVTVGAWASGDDAVNSVTIGGTNGTDAWGIWGGTSLAAPATAGIVALLYDAYHQTTSTYPTSAQARDFLMNGADNVHYDSLIMGAGLSNALRSALIAGRKHGVLVTPSMWVPGDYRGDDFPSFAHTLSQGESNTLQFKVTNTDTSVPTTVNISDGVLRKTGQWMTSFWSNISLESPYDSTRPDYVWNVTPLIPVGTQLIRAIVYENFSSFDPNNDYVADNRYRVLFYNWRDLDGNGTYWTDTNSNGVVNSGELDHGNGTEIMRFTYGYNVADTVEAYVHDPLSRVVNGLLLGVQHRDRNSTVPNTLVHIAFEFYEIVDHGWINEDRTQVTLGGGRSDFFNATINVPQVAGVGVYSAMLILNDGGNETVIPVIVNVAGNSQNISFVADASNTSYYDNGRIYGGFDWSWRPESGDWRFYYTDIPDSATIANGTRLLVHTKWNNVPTDIDTIIMGPAQDMFSNQMNLTSTFGPYTLDTIGASRNTNDGGGVWRFDTITGGSEEWVSAPAVKGLNMIALHNVLYAGEGPSEEFSGETGFVSVSPFPWTEQIGVNVSTKVFDFISTMDILEGIEAVAFGASQPSIYASTVSQGERVSFFGNASEAGVMDIILTCPQCSSFVDLDLYVFHELPGGGEVLVGFSATPHADERVKLNLPDNGTYRFEVHGFNVPTSGVTFELVVDIRQGKDFAALNMPSGPILANVPYQFQVRYTLPDVENDYYGVLLIGPRRALPTIELPILLVARDEAAPVITLYSPVPGRAYKSSGIPAIHAGFYDVRGAFHSGIDMSSVRILIDGRDVSSSADITYGSLWWNLTFLLQEGFHNAEIRMRDLARTPNDAMVSFTFALDDTAPVIVLTSPTVTITRQSLIPVSGFTDPDITMVVINGMSTPTSNGFFNRQIVLIDGVNTITVESTDSVGNTAVIQRTIELDRVPPPLSVTSPAQSTYIRDRSVLVRGLTAPGATVSVNGVNAAVNSSGVFSVRITLVEGPNTIDVASTDTAGNVASTVIGVTVDTIAPTLTVTSPSGAYTRNTRVTVAGITEPTATVQVNGIGVPVAGDGTFSTDIIYAGDGKKTIWVNATDFAGNVVSEVRLVTVDTVAPTLNISIPFNYASVDVPVVEIVGSTEPGALVTVMGWIAEVRNDGRFDVVLALLAPGENTISVVATDLAGNTNSATRIVVYNAPDIKGMQDTIADLQDKVQNLTITVNGLLSSVTGLNNDLRNANNNITTLQYRLDQLNQILTQARNDITTVRADVEALGNVFIMAMALLIVMLFVGLGGIYVALSRKIDSLRGPPEELEELEELEDIALEEEELGENKEKNKKRWKKEEEEEMEEDFEDEDL